MWKQTINNGPVETNHRNASKVIVIITRKGGLTMLLSNIIFPVHLQQKYSIPEVESNLYKLCLKSLLLNFRSKINFNFFIKNY
ncbi:MAG: hypothetical protein AVDCRST_MAG96-4081 [uncultured Segetibacter sp.]|uniref:Uncharacterized protein n=1 Tax=uncultured Segetibacter sp. TaxID=481133 RepID=A0A6J4U414_9BACT|nr:MAG: hypothetical protein AVDCRST_MAG96-4081 [uncultured Segetibacter sp.]